MRTAGVSRITSQLRTAGVLRVLFGSALFGFCGSFLDCALSRSRGSFLGSVLLGSRGPPFGCALFGIVRVTSELRIARCFADHPLSSHCSGLTDRPLGFHRESPRGRPDLLAAGTAMCGDSCPTHLVVGQSQSGMRRVAANVSGPLRQKGEPQIHFVPGSSWFGGPAGPVSLPRTEWRWARRGLQLAADRLDRPRGSRWLPWR